MPTPARRPSRVSAALAALATAALLTAAPAPATAAEPGTGRAAAAPTPGGYAKAARVATNRHRTKHDLRTLRKQKCLQRKAVRQATRMARQERLFHQDLQPVLRDCGLRMVGENVAMGYPTGRAVVNRGWMRSEGHRANILNGGFRLMGLAARRSADGTWYSAQVFGTRG